MTLITWLREEKAATEQTSICQLRCIGNAHFTRGIRNIWSWCCWSGVGTELHQSHDTKQGQSEVKYYCLFFFLIFPIFPFPYSSHPAAGKTNQPQPIEQNLPHTPCTAKPNGTEPTNIFCGWSVSTSAVQLPTTHPRAFYIPASGWILLKNTAFIDFISQLVLAFFLAIHHQL